MRNEEDQRIIEINPEEDRPLISESNAIEEVTISSEGLKEILKALPLIQSLPDFWLEWLSKQFLVLFLIFLIVGLFLGFWLGSNYYMLFESNQTKMKIYEDNFKELKERENKYNNVIKELEKIKIRINTLENNQKNSKQTPKENTH